MVDAGARQALIARYKEGYQAVLAAPTGMTDAALDARPVPDAWSLRQIVHYLADSDMTSASRTKHHQADG